MKQKIAQEILQKNKTDWEKIAEKFSDTRHNIWPELISLTKYVKNNDKILDLGCGNGRLCQLFQNRPVEYIGIDSSHKLINLAKKQFDKAIFKIGDALNLTFKKEQFNVVFVIAFLHHIPSKRLRLKVLKNCYDVLKPGGFLILTVWNLWQPRLLFKYKIFPIKKDVYIPFKLPDKKIMRYYHAFTVSELKKLIKKADFKIINSYFVKGKLRTNWRKGFNLVVIAKKV